MPYHRTSPLFSSGPFDAFGPGSNNAEISDNGRTVIDLFGNDRFVISGNDNLLIDYFGNDRIEIRGNGNTVDAGFGDDVVRTFGNNTVVNGGGGDDRLFGGDGNVSLWGGRGNDVIRTGAGNDYALGGAGDDVTDTGSGLGIHFGGAGNDTFVIGADIVGNGQKDTVIALDFGNGSDRLQVAPEILGDIASITEGKVDLVPVLAAYDADGLGVADVGARLAHTFLGAETFAEVAEFLSQFTPNESGQILVDATIVTTNGGDTIIALGVTQDQLLAAVA
ncbi:calcium-binding protein [Alsobacter sp. KACC 23698]|uniref:Calcium-binding protein n=1 Tax=Alsobacter sp. KACC 23698 TaxID=3149229 RepID=A0AAU7JHE9_9HYPH